MKRIIKTGLPEFGRPTEHAVMAGRILYTAVVPLKSDGTFETGEPKKQLELTLSNLRQILEAAGGNMAHITQALVFLTSADHIPMLNEIWAKSIMAPYPNRAIVIVNAIGVKDVIVLIQVHAHIEK